jgi:hypothetical protein
MTDSTSALLEISSHIRYAAVYRDGQLKTASRAGRAGASAAESDRYEELIVNPTLLTLVGQRGAIDCGGVAYVFIRYGNFFQLVVPVPGGHASICIEPDADPLALVAPVCRAPAGTDG